MKKNKNNSPRHQARCYAMQVIYQWHFTQQNGSEIIQTFMDDPEHQQMEINYFKELVSGVVDHVTEIDATIQPHLDRNLTELNPVELAILRLATYEFLHRLDVPYRVVINEAIEIAKSYGSVEGYKYINGVLDKMASLIRKTEVKA